MLRMADADSTSFIMQAVLKAKEYAIPLSIGFAIILWRLIRWLGLAFIDDLNSLKNKSNEFVTREELDARHDKVLNRIDTHFEKLSTDIRDVHGRVDDIHKTILVNRVAEWKRNNETD